MKRGINHKRINISIDAETISLLKEIKEKHMLSVSMAIRAALKEYRDAHHYE